MVVSYGTSTTFPLTHRWLLWLLVISSSTEAWTIGTSSLAAFPTGVSGLASQRGSPPQLRRRRQQQKSQPQQQRPKTWLSTASLSSSLAATEVISSESETVTLQSISKEYGGILDGAEWASIQWHLRKQGRWPNVATNTSGGPRNGGGNIDSTAAVAYLSIVTGTTLEGERVVALRRTGQQVYTDSLTRIPTGVTDLQAARTFQCAWASVHCLLPTITGIGGGGNDSAMLVPEGSQEWRVVVLGSNDHAVTAARGLASMGCRVHLVTPSVNNPAVQRYSKLYRVWNTEQDFGSELGSFDALLDTTGNEREDTPTFLPHRNSIRTLLASRHNCHVYVSTETQQQAIMGRNGLLMGPREAKSHVQSVQTRSAPMLQPPPPRQLGSTVETLLKQGVIWPDGATMLISSANARETILRGWTMGEYWESTTWPRNVDYNVRIGLPTIAEDEDDDDDDNYDSRDEKDAGKGRNNVPLMGNERKQAILKQYFQDQQRVSDESKTNSDVVYFAGVRGLHEFVIDKELDCVVFLSAPFCRTCRYLSPSTTVRLDLPRNHPPPVQPAVWTKQLSFVRPMPPVTWGRSWVDF